MFLNLCIAQETHLENIEEYKKVAEAFTLTDRRANQSKFFHFCCVSIGSEFIECIVCLIQFQLDAETLSESLSRLNSTLDPQSLTKKSNPEALLTLEVRLFHSYGAFVLKRAMIEVLISPKLPNKSTLISMKSNHFVKCLQSPGCLRLYRTNHPTGTIHETVGNDTSFLTIMAFL